MVLVIAVLYHLRVELHCQYNANTTGDDTLYFPDQRGELLGSGRNVLHTIISRNQSTVGKVCRVSRISALMCHRIDSEL